MTTASEFVYEYMNQFTDLDWLIYLIAERDRDGKIETLQEAAKLMCSDCQVDEPFLHDGTWCHNEVGHAKSLRPCAAKNVHDRIAELEAQK